MTATLEATNGRGVDAILDVVGAEYLDRNLRCLASDGHLVTTSGRGGSPSLDLSLLLARRASVTATPLNPRPLSQKATIVDGVRSEVVPLLESQAINQLCTRRIRCVTQLTPTHCSNRVPWSVALC